MLLVDGKERKERKKLYLYRDLQALRHIYAIHTQKSTFHILSNPNLGMWRPENY